MLLPIISYPNIYAAAICCDDLHASLGSDRPFGFLDRVCLSITRNTKFRKFAFHGGGCMKWREALTVRIDVTPVRAEVSLAVTQGHVVAVYGLDLVEAWSAIYEIHPVGIARR